MKKKCEFCEKEFDVRPAEKDRRKTCSKSCMYKLRSKKLTKTVKCEICDSEIIKTQSQINRSKSGFNFCSNKCVGIYNAKKYKEEAIIKTCLICDKKFNTIKARSNSITCSRECQGVWQTKNRIKENSSNWRGGGGEKCCLYCNELFKTETPSTFESRKFCGKNCKNKYWVENTLYKDDTFRNAQYEGMLKYRKETKETKPERMVREYLESKGLINDKDFFQEKGMFRKYYVDFYIPKDKTVIEVFGDFWHANPKIYGGDLKPLYESQTHQIKVDKQRRIDFENSVLDYYELWEFDIYKDLDILMSKINLTFPLNDYTQDT